MTTSCILDRARGAASRVVFQEEVCWGTPDMSGQQPRVIDVVSETLRNQINKIESQLIRPNRLRAAPQQGNQRPAGDINGELQPMTWPTLLRLALCRESAVAVTGSGPYKHTFNGQPDLDDGFTTEKRFHFRDSPDIVLQYRGCRVNQFFFAIPVEGVVTARLGIIAKREKQQTPGAISTDDQSIEDVRAAISPSGNQPYNSYHAALTISGTPIALVTSLDFTLNNNFDPEGFAIDGTPYRVDLTEGDRQISGNGAVFFTPASFAQFYPAYLNNDTIGLRITMARGNQSLRINLPSIKYTGDLTPAITGKGPLSIPFGYSTFEDETDHTDIECEVVNNDHHLGTDV